MKPLTREQRAQLKSLAEKAADGPWELTHHGVVQNGVADIAEVFHHSDGQFIAACAPDVVLRMLARLDELEKLAADIHDRLVDEACS